MGDECVAGACKPACASGIRCGAADDVCCSAGDVCVAKQCKTPGSVCADHFDCPEDAFCEPVLGKCLPQIVPVACEYKPPVGALTPKLEWSWTGSAIAPQSNQVINTPLVVDLDKDGTPDVVIVTSENYSSTGVGHVRALDGKTGLEKWTATADVYVAANQVNPRGTPAVGDLDGDGWVEIVAPKRGGGVIAFRHDGSLLWTSKQADGTTPYTSGFESVTIALADLDGDGSIEVVAGGVVFDKAGKLLFDKGPYAGSNNGNYGAVSVVADVDQDGKQEILTGRRAFRSDGTVMWDNGLVDGYPAIADLDLDGKAELVVVAAGKVRVQDALTGALLAELAMPGSGAGGPPTIAQFDGVGGPDFASAGGTSYTVFHYEPKPTPAISVLWTKDTQDLSSNRTGSTVFDFEGDGKAEVIYNDECYMRVYAGETGDVLIELPNSSATIHEYPVVADVDADNNTEIIVVANDLNHQSGNPSCPYGKAGARRGVFVYGDANDSWVRTRRVWNQHAYHVTNIENSGAVSSPEDASWGPKGFNNYRQSTQGKAVYNAPDLAVDLAASILQCPTSVGLVATVKNQGSLGASAGVTVRFYQGVSPAGILVGQAVTTKPLLPGGSEVLTVPVVTSGAPPFAFYVVVDEPTTVHECVESNNTGVVANVFCGKL